MFDGNASPPTRVNRVRIIALRLTRGAREAGGERVAVAAGADVVAHQRAAWRAHRERPRKLRDAAICW